VRGDVFGPRLNALFAALFALAGASEPYAVSQAFASGSELDLETEIGRITAHLALDTGDPGDNPANGAKYVVTAALK
jgi:hypothetical protein